MSGESIAFLVDYYHPFEIGGAERSTAVLGQALIDAGLRILVITPNYGAARSEVADRIEIIRLPFPQRLEPGQLARRFWLANPVLQVLYGVAVACIIRRRRIQLLHVQNSQILLAGGVASWLSRRPMVVTIRDLAYLDTPRPGPPAGGPSARRLKIAADERYVTIERRLKLGALRRARRLVFVSRGLQTLYASQFPTSLMSRSTVVHNIGPGPTETPPERRCRAMVLFVGKLSTGKGLHVLYAAIPLILERLPAATFEVVGAPGVGWSPPPLAIQKHVHLRGRLSESAVKDLMTRAALLVMPSVWPEPLSRVLLEAMSRQLPIVTTAVGGNTEAVDDEGAAVVPPNNPDALAAAVVRLLCDANAAATLAQNALKRYRTLFTRDQIVPKILDVYRTAL